MAKAATAVKNDDEEVKVPATVKAGGPPAELMDEMAGFEGAGTSGASDDNIVPFLVLLQELSPEKKKGNNKYIKGAEAGCVVNRATGELWSPDPETGYLYNGGGQQMFLQPAVFRRAVVEWVPRDAGGGLVRSTPLGEGEAVDDLMRKLGGRQVPDPRDSTGRKLVWKTTDGNDLIDTRYQFANVVYDDGHMEAVTLSFSSTGHQAARGWMTHMRNSRLGDKIAPAWFKKYPVRTVLRSGNNNEWFVMVVDDGEWIADKHVRAMGAEFYKSVSTGAVQAAPEEDNRGGGGAVDDDIPF